VYLKIKKDDNRRSIPVSQFRLSIVVFPLYFAFRVTALPQYRYFMSLRRALVFISSCLSYHHKPQMSSPSVWRVFVTIPTPAQQNKVFLGHLI